MFKLKYIIGIDFLSYLQSNCSWVNAHILHLWLVNISSGNWLMPSGNMPLPEPMLTQVLFYYMVSPGANEFNLSCFIHLGGKQAFVIVEIVWWFFRKHHWWMPGFQSIFLIIYIYTHVFYFYPGPVLAFGYCRCLRLCVCVFVCVCVNNEFVHMITRGLFKPGSQNVDQRCNTLVKIPIVLWVEWCWSSWSNLT